jgi:hypothetical protein
MELPHNSSKQNLGIQSAALRLCHVEKLRPKPVIRPYTQFTCWLRERVPSTALNRTGNLNKYGLSSNSCDFYEGGAFSEY